MDLQKPLTLALNRKSNAHIVTQYSPRAAGILSDYLKKITGGIFPIQAVTDIQNNLILKQVENENPDGFCYYIFDKDIVFEAPNEQAAVYAVYDFLEVVCGCRYYTSTEEYLPFNGNLTVQFDRQETNPVLAYREVYYRDYFDADFVNHNVKMLFSQANREYEGEFSALRGYLLAKCMWNPAIDANAVIADFCKGYYGPAADPILQYIADSTKAMEDAGGSLSIFGGPLDAKESWMDEAHFYHYNTLIEMALEQAKGNPSLSYRVKSAAMPVWYAGIVLKYGSKEERMERIMKFAAHARKQGLERVEEWKITPDQFITDAIAALE